MKHKIVSYGWAFTPPTIGHKAIIDGLLEKIAEKVLIIPSGPRIDKTYAYSREVRKRFLEIFASEFEDGRVELDTTWLDGEWETTTLGMDDVLTTRYGYSIPQVFGADVSGSMKNWDYDNTNRDRLIRLLPKIFVARKWVELILDDMDHYEILDIEVPEASSTAVREQGRVDLLTERVRDAYQNLVLKN